MSLENEGVPEDEYSKTDISLIDTLPYLMRCVVLSILSVSIIFIIAKSNIYGEAWKPVLTRNDMLKLFCTHDYKATLTERQKIWNNKECHADDTPKSIIESDSIKIIKIAENALTLLSNKEPIEPKFILRPFYGHPFIYIIPMALFGLSSLLIVVPRWMTKDKLKNNGLPGFKQSLHWYFILYIFFRLPNLWRNINYGTNMLGPDEERVLFSFSQRDFCFPCFVSLELCMFLLSILLVEIWKRWSIMLKTRRNILIKDYKTTNKHGYDAYKYIASHKNVDLFSRTFFEWQISSIFLAIAFFPFSKYYWHIYYGLGDKKFIYDAILIHGLWAFTWIVISLPLFITAYKWKLIRYKALEYMNDDLSSQKNFIGIDDKDTKIEIAMKEIDTRLKLLPEILPIGFWNLTGSLITAAIAAIWPILRNVWS